jgi:threonine aldolase
MENTVQDQIPPFIDLRSDTVSWPTLEMRMAMANAVVGDDVWGDDPTVIELEEYSAKLFNKEAACFLSSGTQGNLISVMVHCRPGDEMILGSSSHIVVFEGGGCSALAGVIPACLQVQPDGTLKIEDIKAAVRKVDNHFPTTRLICLENTQNLCGGQTLPLEYINEVAEFAHQNNIKLHMDGARIFNAQAESGVSVAKICENVDSVTFCLSKGLCAPVGSVLCGTKEFIHEAKRKRKMLGGGMRQVGMLAAAGLVAIKKHPQLLQQDHAVAQFLREKIATIPGLKVLSGSTNFIFFEILGDAKVKPTEFAELMKKKGILLASARGLVNAFRIVTHYWITLEKAQQVIDAMNELFGDSK